MQDLRCSPGTHIGQDTHWYKESFEIVQDFLILLPMHTVPTAEDQGL